MRNGIKTLFFFLLTTVILTVSSYFLINLWGVKSEKKIEHVITLNDEMTIKDFAQINKLSPETIKDVFGKDNIVDQRRKISNLPYSSDEIIKRTKKEIALEEEHASKNWAKILLKFALWTAFLSFLFTLLRKKAVSTGKRIILLLTAFTVFGVILGPDPSPMGTVKDAVVLFFKDGVIFPPRMIAFAVMIIFGTVIANKILCSWGCQFGTLQDFIFNLNGTNDSKKTSFPQYKIPFAVTNSMRFIFFITIMAAAAVLSTDIVKPIDPFNIYNPATVTVAGAIFIGTVLVLSLFVYRPWCHFFCPFGFVGWIAEKLSIYKIKVNYDSCIACGTCAEVCPSTVMSAILKRDKTIPDCFLCGKCLVSCPTKSVNFGRGKREMPPENKFGE